MPAKLSTIILKIPSIPNKKNAKLLEEFLEYMRETGASERHQGNELLVMIYYARFLGQKRDFYQVRNSKQITEFLDSKKKSKDQDPDGR